MQDLGQEGEIITTDMVKEGDCIPFPHESHQVLVQELLHIFGAGILICAGIGSGLSVLGGLLSGARVVAICISKAHRAFVEQNVFQWLKEKKLVPGVALSKPHHLLAYESKRNGVSKIGQSGSASRNQAGALL